MVHREIEKRLGSWAKRHALCITDVYRDTFHYVDVVDDVGGKYEISVYKDDESHSIKVRVWDHQKKSRGFKVDLSELEKALEQAYAQIMTWTKKSKGTRIFTP